MRNEPTFHLLSARTRWPTLSALGVGDGDGISLAAAPDGPLALKTADGSLGRLMLPRGLALDRDWRVYLLSGAAIKRFDPHTGGFVTLPGLGGAGRGVRRFHFPTSIAVVGGLLYVADTGNTRVQVFDLHSLSTRHVFTIEGWLPIDVAAHGNDALILDGRGQAVWRHRAGQDRLECVLCSHDDKSCWKRIAVDRSGGIYLYDARRDTLAKFDMHEKFLRKFNDAADVRAQFDSPPILMSADRRFALPAGLMRECGRDVSGAAAVDAPALKGVVFNRDGTPAALNPDETVSIQAAYISRGRWYSSELDSERYNCQWDRVVAEVELWPSTRLSLAAYSSNVKVTLADLIRLPPEAWCECLNLRGAAELPETGQPERFTVDALIQNGPGQYLYLCAWLQSDGYASPRLIELRAHFPRQTYLDFLPGVYGASPGNQDVPFTEQLLSIVRAEWQTLEARIDALPDWFDPLTAPEQALPMLAAWLDIPLERTWTAEQQRTLLANLPGTYAKRGTRDGLRDVLRLYLSIMTGLPLNKQGAHPVIVEGFQERDRAMLTTDGATLRGVRLWGPAEIGRLQLGAYAREGEARLVSTSDPARDIFHAYAHRFTVFVPAAWLRDEQQLGIFRRVLDTEKPAHTQYRLCLVDASMRVGVQSALGFDTIVSARQHAQLGDGLTADGTSTLGGAQHGSIAAIGADIHL